MKKNQTFKVGDKVVFIHPNYKIYNRDGVDVYKDLVEGNTYTVNSTSILCIELLESRKMYLKENFRKI